jgi:hypothetical protein
VIVYLAIELIAGQDMTADRQGGVANVGRCEDGDDASLPCPDGMGEKPTPAGLIMVREFSGTGL